MPYLEEERCASLAEICAEIELRCYYYCNGGSVKERMLRECQMSFLSSTSNFSSSKQESLSQAQIVHQPSSNQMFLKCFGLGLFLCGAFFTLRSGHEFLCLFKGIFKLKSTNGEHSVYYQTQMFDNCTCTTWQSLTQRFNVLLVTTHRLEVISNAKKRFSFIHCSFAWNPFFS